MIELPGNMMITADHEQYIVGRGSSGGCRGVVIKKPRYYPSLETAARAALQQAMCDKVAAGEITSLRDYLQELQRVKAELAELLEPLKA